MSTLKPQSYGPYTAIRRWTFGQQ